MDEIVFPDNLGEFSKKRFSAMFLENCKIVEYTRNWYESTGIFKKFMIYCKNRLENSDNLIAHEKRCFQYVKNMKRNKVPSYLLIYKIENELE